MELTVQQIIERSSFSDFVVYAGTHGLRARRVRTVCVVDTFYEPWNKVKKNIIESFNQINLSIIRLKRSSASVWGRALRG
jgi:hypothetical protein